MPRLFGPSFCWANRFNCDRTVGIHGLPEKVTIDKSGSNQSALVAINNELPENKEIEVRQIKYLNNRVEQDHRSVKRITNSMMGFKALHSARVTLAGIELHPMLKKGQYKNAANMSVFEQFYALAV